MSVAQAACDLDIHASTLRNWRRQQTAGSKSAFAGRWHMKPEQQEIERPRSEVKNLKSERNIPKKPRPPSRKGRREIRLQGEAPRDLAGTVDVPGARCLAWRVLRVAEPPAERPGGPWRRAGTGDTIELRGQRTSLWRPSGLARGIGCRSGMRPAADRAFDAKPWSAGTATSPTPTFGYRGRGRWQPFRRTPSTICRPNIPGSIRVRQPAPRAGRIVRQGNKHIGDTSAAAPSLSEGRARRPCRCLVLAPDGRQRDARRAEGHGQRRQRASVRPSGPAGRLRRRHPADPGGTCLAKPPTPDATSDILETVTRATAIELLRDEMRLVTMQRATDSTELCAAEEAFHGGSCGEIQTILSIDRLPVGTGCAGPATAGRRDWPTPVLADSPARPLRPPATAAAPDRRRGR